jgi:hypothetical protein
MQQDKGATFKNPGERIMKLKVTVLQEKEDKVVCLADLKNDTYYTAKEWSYKNKNCSETNPCIFIREGCSGLRITTKYTGGMNENASSYHLKNPVEITELDLSGLNQ